MGEDYEQLTGDETSQDASKLNQEIGREEGQGSWDQIDTAEEEDVSGEIEAGNDTDDDLEGLPSETVTVQDPQDESGLDKEPEESEETDQKNTLSGEPNRVLSFKDFFNKN